MSLLILGICATVVSAGVGYALGLRQHPNLRDLPPGVSTGTNDTQPETDIEEDEEDSEDEEDLADGDLSAIKAGMLQHCKLVLVVRTDLKMTPGKIAAQCGHATLACYKALSKKNPKLLQHWERTGQAKIVLKGTSEEQLMELEAIAKSLNLCARHIEDAGRTQVEPGSRTVLGIGPAPVDLINQVTGHLRLL
ncbi:PTH2-domain-containing protein [Dentipellis sp. KUC8613]|nr:PTH2-domain-containing protein [Dentipellis sp. KUC8613]